MSFEMFDGIGLEEALRFEHHELPIVAPEALTSIESVVPPIVEGESIIPDMPGTEVLNGGLPAIMSVLHSIGVDVPEDIVADISLIDVLLPGISLANLHNFLAWLEVDTYLLSNGDIHDVCNWISEGYMVILSGDGGELLGTDDPFEDDFHGEHADRAFVIKDFDLSDPENPMVTLYAFDGSGADGVTIPVSQLEDAWADGGRDYLVIPAHYLMDGSEVFEGASELDAATERLSRRTM